MKDELLNLPFKNKIEFIKKGKHLDVYIEDKDPDIRILVARKGYGLNQLINDKNIYVRMEVARQGYGLSKLIRSNNPFVKRQVIKYCEKHPEKEECKKILLLENL